MKKLHLPITIFTCIALSLSLATTAQPDDASKQGIRDVQQVLKDCGFNPGQIDGIWGNQTTVAARSFLQAHGEPSTSDNTTILMTQVDSYRIGDDGPCPNKVTDVADQAQEEAGQPGKPVDAIVDMADQAQEGEAKDNETELIAQVKHAVPSGGNHSWELDGGLKYEIKILDDGIRFVWHSDHLYRTDGYPGIYLTEYTIKFVDIGEVLPDGRFLRIGCRKHEDCVQVSNTGKRMATEKQEGAEWNNVVSHESYLPYGNLGTHTGVAFTQDTNVLATALKNLIAYYDNNGNQPAGQPPAKCYEWVALGEFNIGKWINGNGQETGSLPVGSDRKFHDRDELETDYKDYHRNCKSSAESALDNAINAMILVGRHTDDIEDERKRISAFYQGNLDKCQAHFKRLWEKYEGWFCE